MQTYLPGSMQLQAVTLSFTVDNFLSFCVIHFFTDMYNFYYFGRAFISYTFFIQPQYVSSKYYLDQSYEWMSSEDVANWGEFKKAVSADTFKLKEEEVFYAGKNKKEVETINEKLKVLKMIHVQEVYIFEHQVSPSFSSMQNVSSSDYYKQTVVDESYLTCDDYAHHYLLEPFFIDNRNLQQVYREYLEMNDSSMVQQRLNDLLKSCEYGVHQCDVHGVCIDENGWTMQLCEGMKELDFMKGRNCKYTADRGLSFPLLQREIAGTCAKYFYFTVHQIS